ncbi:transcription factor [Carpediemonas membranifera]|uniref:Transcription factor n=1 Tax=Carpediemonas membranifera TaxID=201153 RepID=A0A8J6B1C6_9EUKA|nr:transcription factor [Carpediemonas membranifera]|eukprot:KAG9396345.1 transcription factor [Carpediemonas membranifera]
MNRSRGTAVSLANLLDSRIADIIAAKPFGKTLEESLRECGQWRDPETIEGEEGQPGDQVYERNVAGSSVQVGDKGLNARSFTSWTQSRRWSKNETKLFYKGVQCFGTDFDGLASVFPNRSRLEVKRKFTRERKKPSCVSLETFLSYQDMHRDPTSVPEFADAWEELQEQARSTQNMTAEEILAADEAERAALAAQRSRASNAAADLDGALMSEEEEEEEGDFFGY